MLYKVTGREAVVAAFQDFLANMLLSQRVEAVTQVGQSDKWLVLFCVHISGNSEEVPIVDLVTLRGAQIARVDNCFDTAKMPAALKQKAGQASNV